jgi:hypothetical protein
MRSGTFRTSSPTPRPPEAVNLRSHAIHLQTELPYVEVLTDGRRLKTKQSLRKIPPAGAALAVMKWRPHFLLPPSAAGRIAHGLSSVPLSAPSIASGIA